MRLRPLIACCVAALAAAPAALALGTASSIPAVPNLDSIGATAKFGSVGDRKLGRAGATIPFWSSSFVAGGVSYPYAMVGTSPFGPAASTTVPTTIVPVRAVFPDGSVLDGSDRLASVLGSPVFQAAAFTSGRTQYVDAIMRAEFWSAGGSSAGYHVLLAAPTIAAPLELDVPGGVSQLELSSRAGHLVGLVKDSWFSNQVSAYLKEHDADPHALTIFLTDNVLLYLAKPSECCEIGFHGSDAQQHGDGAVTYAFAAYLAPGTFRNAMLADIHGLSHEVAEWASDPFTDNAAPPWTSPLAPQYGCSSALETGDPLVGVGFLVNGYHPQDEAYLSWFARQTPSLGQFGRYTYLGTFVGFSPGC